MNGGGGAAVGESSLSGVWFICATQVLINDNSGTPAAKTSRGRMKVNEERNGEPGEKKKEQALFIPGVRACVCVCGRDDTTENDP